MGQNNGFYSVEEITDRLSISTLVFWEHRPLAEDSLQELADAGISRIELVESTQQYNMADSTSMKRIGKMCQSCGIEIIAYHCHLTSLSAIESESHRIEYVDHCRRQIDTMLELGGKAWASHSKPLTPMVLKAYQDLAKHVEGTGAIIMVENFAREDTTVENRMAFLDEIDHPQVKMVLDIGHVRNDAGENPMALPGGPTTTLDLCGNRLGFVHLHGFKDGADHYPPFVAGDTIQWVELFRKLYEINYAGPLNFEPHGEHVHKGSLAAVCSVPQRIVEMNQQTP